MKKHIYKSPILLEREYKMVKSFRDLLVQEQQKSYFQQIRSRINSDRAKGYRIFPAKNEIFSALQLCPLEKIKVVILGQDPYHTSGHAHGLAFSSCHKQLPPSLKNIFKSIQISYPNIVLEHGDLSS